MLPEPTPPKPEIGYGTRDADFTYRAMIRAVQEEQARKKRAGLPPAADAPVLLRTERLAAVDDAPVRKVGQ